MSLSLQRAPAARSNGARDDRDAAVAALPHSADEDVLANPAPIALLPRVVVARCQLAEVDCCLVPVTGASS